MKKIPKLTVAIILTVLLCIPATLSVFYYTKPMKDVSYNLSLLAEDGQEWEGDKGWEVFTDENGQRTELTADGTGGYTGLNYPGQTFYYSRRLKEKPDSPTIQIGAVNRTISIFLDETMIYTDCPESDNRIGYLKLPMLEYDRTEPVTVSLPPDYLGKTLTIAQSSPEFSETQSDDGTVWPCEVMLYCGYAYESGLIASASKTMLPAVLLFSLELFLLTAFIWIAFNGKLALKLPVLGAAILFQICKILAQADFFYQYFGLLPLDPVWLCFHLSVGALLLFIALYAKHFRPLFFTMTILQWLSILLYIFTQTTGLLEYGELSVFFSNLPQLSGFFALLVVLIGVFLEWKKGIRFFRHMSYTAFILITGYILFLIAGFFFSPDYLSSVLSRFSGEIKLLLPDFTLKLLWNLSLISTLVAVMIDLIEEETQRRTMLAILSQKNDLAMESYENLRQQSEEIMMFRHDMMKHYTLLQTMAKENPEKITGYLDELIGQMKTIRPVVSTRNSVLDILLNGKLNIAAQKGISVEIERSDAPKFLPLTDTEACCLIINILDNAIYAAAKSKADSSYIRLDFHCKNQHFVFSCENSKTNESEDGKKAKKTPVPLHGYGLKIIHQIMSRWGDNMVSTEQTNTTYKITIIIPLSD